MKSKWSVIGAYEGAKSRDALVAFCGSLVNRFWADYDFEVLSWSFADLEDSARQQEAVQKASTAEFIVFATDSGKDLPWHVKGWAETWLARRREREGTLAALQARDSQTVASTLAYLRQLAHRAGMDFLTDVPQHISHPFAESTEVYTARARVVTNVLNDILRQPRMPTTG